MKNREKYAEEIKSIVINGNNDINLCNKIIKPIILKQNNINCIKKENYDCSYNQNRELNLIKETTLYHD